MKLKLVDTMLIHIKFDFNLSLNSHVYWDTLLTVCTCQEIRRKDDGLGELGKDKLEDKKRVMGGVSVELGGGST